MQGKPLTQKGIWSGDVPNIMDFFVLLIFASISFVCFDQAFDMRLSMLHASDFLDCIFRGVPFSFYQHVLDKASSGLYFGLDETNTAASYNIVIYLILAIWVSPLYILKHVTFLSNYEDLVNLWGRILGIGLSVYSSVILRRLFKKIFSGQSKSRWAGYFFISSPLILYCVIITDQFDIISVILTLLALFLYFDKKYYSFSLIMSIAICFKLFPLLIFVPLILLVEKNILKLLQYVGIAVSVFAFTTISSSCFDVGFNKVQGLLQDRHDFKDLFLMAQIPGGIKNISLFLFCIIIICSIAYFTRVKEGDLPVISCLFCAASYASLFIFVNWHPQWFVILLPFLTLIIFQMKNIKIGILLETMISAGFLLVGVPVYLIKQHMTNTIMVTFTKSHFRLPDMLYFPAQIYPPLGQGVLPMTIFVGFLISFLVIAWFDFHSKEDPSNILEKDIRMVRILLYFRTALILIYIVPPLAAYFSTPLV